MTGRISKRWSEYSQRNIITLEHPLLQEDIEFLAGLFEKYIMDHIEKIGGFDKLRLMTHDELMSGMRVTDLFYALKEWT